MKTFSNCLWLLLFVQIALPQQDNLTGSIQGLVIDGRTSRPLHGVNVIIERTSYGVPTGEDGTFEIPDLPLDTLYVRAGFVGYNPLKIRVVLKPERPQALLYISMYREPLEDIDGYKSIPSHWKQIDAGGRVSFSVPPDFKKDPKPILGDSYSESFISQSMKLRFDFDYVPIFDSNSTGYREYDAIIGCRRATIKTFHNPEEDSEYPYVTAVDFGRWYRFVLQVSYKKKSDEDNALRILHSIQFPK